MAPERKRGTIVRILREKVYGFIHCPADRRDYFFHQTALVGCTLADLRDGSGGNEAPSEVSFLVGKSREGKERAEDVRIARG